jgi:hypothetical protein
MDCAAPGLLLAQGIGRIGNWWNQELYGKATTLPWGLKIDEAHRPFGSTAATYQPTFLYELIWDLAGVVLLIWVGKRFRIKPPGLFALYVSYYTFGRFFEELRSTIPSHRRLAAERVGLDPRLHLLHSFFVWWQFFHTRSPARSIRRSARCPKGRDGDPGARAW